MKTNQSKKRITFRFIAPEAREVCVAGSFNNWDARSLKPDGTGSWKTWTNLEPGMHQYRFIVDGMWQDDPACVERMLNEFGTFNMLLKVE